MATYRCSVKPKSRADGCKAVAAAAYRAGDRLRDDRYGAVHDYRRRQRGIVHAEIIAPGHAPAWTLERERLWNEAEAAERRKDSVVVREVEVSLPHELSDAGRLDLVQGFARALVDRYEVAVDFAVHRPDRDGDARNHHAHLSMTTRRMTGQGLGEKTRELDDRLKRGPVEIEAIRLLWETECNAALERAGCRERVDRRTNAAQGIEREPEPKLGPKAAAMERFGVPTLKGDWQRAARRRDGPAVALAEAAYKSAMGPRWHAYARRTAQRKAEAGETTRAAVRRASEAFREAATLQDGIGQDDIGASPPSSSPVPNTAAGAFNQQAGHRPDQTAVPEPAAPTPPASLQRGQERVEARGAATPLAPEAKDASKGPPKGPLRAIDGDGPAAPIPYEIGLQPEPPRSRTPRRDPAPRPKRQPEPELTPEQRQRRRTSFAASYRQEKKDKADIERQGARSRRTMEERHARERAPHEAPPLLARLRLALSKEARDRRAGTLRELAQRQEREREELARAEALRKQQLAAHYRKERQAIADQLKRQEATERGMPDPSHVFTREGRPRPHDRDRSGEGRERSRGRPRRKP